MSEKTFTEVTTGGDIEYIKPAALEGLGGIEGTFISTLEPSQPGYSPSFKFEREDGSIFVLNGCAALINKMGEVVEGSLVRVESLGLKAGRGGKSYHDIKVLVAD